MTKRKIEINALIYLGACFLFILISAVLHFKAIFADGVVLEEEILWALGSLIAAFFAGVTVALSLYPRIEIIKNGDKEVGKSLS